MASFRAVVVMLLLAASLAIAGPASAQEFSGNVDVILRANGILDINGDNGDNRITLCQNPDDAEEFTVIIITSSFEYETETRNGVTKDVRINMRGGDDVVQLNGNAAPPADCDDFYPPPPPLQGDIGANDDICHADDHGCPGMLFPRDVRVFLGSGYNSFSGYEFGVVDDLTVRGGSGFDAVSLRYVNVWDRADINTLGGNSSVFVRDSYFGRSTWRAGSGADRFEFSRTDLGNRPLITTSAGVDNVFLQAVAEGRVTINTGSGEDLLRTLFYCPDPEGDCGGAESRPYLLNVIMGAHNDRTVAAIPLIAGDRLNGGSGNQDTLETFDVGGLATSGGPTINGYELIVPLEP
ncbi:MAG: hypothetical protein ACRBK7_11680 [Acidimicrobiales bacterium]